LDCRSRTGQTRAVNWRLRLRVTKIGSLSCWRCRGGVPVAAEVAAALNAPLDLILARKIGVPFEPELAMGAVVDGSKPLVVRNEKVIRFAGIEERDFNSLCESELAEVARRRGRYLGDRKSVDVTGMTARAASLANRK